MTYRCDEQEQSLWNEKDGFYYDAIQWSNGHSQQIPVRSLVGLMPLYATAILEPHILKKFPSFRKVSPSSICNQLTPAPGLVRREPPGHCAAQPGVYEGAWPW